MRTSAPYAVSKLHFSVTDTSRDETLGESNSGSKRQIEVVLYYPVNKPQDENAPKAKYLSDIKRETVANSMKLDPEVFNLETDIYDSLPFIEGERFPLLIFGHGYGSYAESCTMLFKDIVSNGYIVASVGHPYESSITEFEDGTYALMDPTVRRRQMGKINLKNIAAHAKLAKTQKDNQQADEAFEEYKKNVSPFSSDRIKVWCDDNLYVIKVLKERYSNILDLSHGVAVSGHSYGGAAAYSMCLTCDEISCGLNIDGGLFGDHKDLILNKPFYQISCVKNLTLVSRIFTKRTSPLYVATFKNLKHGGLTDLKFLPTDINTGSMKAINMQTNLSACHISFLNKYLKGMDVDMNVSTNKDVEITYYSPEDTQLTK